MTNEISELSFAFFRLKTEIDLGMSRDWNVIFFQYERVCISVNRKLIGDEHKIVMSFRLTIQIDGECLHCR